MKKKLTPAGKFSPKIDWSKNVLSKSQLKQVLGGSGTETCPKTGSVTDDPFKLC